MEFNEVTQAQLEEYERQYFDILNVPELKGVHRNATGNINAADAAGWFAESVNGLSPIERLQVAKDVDAKYLEFTQIDPNG
jgi:hypothetical protein